MRQHFAAIFILAFYHLSDVSGEVLELIPGIQEAVRNMNESFVVACRGPKSANATWTGPKGKPITADKGRVHVERREVGQSGSFLSLVFESIERLDKGGYTCTARINDTKEELSFNLTVVKPIAFVGLLDVQNVTEFKSETVRCEVTGDPLPTIIWQFKGKELPRIDGRYNIMSRGIYITNITREDAGLYLCRAFQVTPQSSTVKDRHIRLIVHHKPTWRTPLVHGDMEEGKVFGYKGGLANLTCEVDSVPEADFKWTRNNASVDPSLRILNDPNKSVLQVPMVNATLLGKYECTAENAIGRMWKAFDLREGTRPPPPSSVSVQSVGATSAVFRITRGSHDTLGYRIQFAKRYPENYFSNPDYQDVFTGAGKPYTIVNLTENTAYVMRIAARNRAGLSDFSEIYSFKTRMREASAACRLASGSIGLLLLTSLLASVGSRTWLRGGLVW